MNPDIFEAVMLICFGCAWPMSIYRTWKTKSSRGKSLFFLGIIFIGYIAGICFELFGDRNLVILLYILNALMVLLDLVLSATYRRREADAAVS